jgi:hypothetical protein
MKNGRLYDATNLTEVWPRQRPLPVQWWWNIEPPGEAPVPAANAVSGGGRRGGGR